MPDTDPNADAGLGPGTAEVPFMSDRARGYRPPIGGAAERPLGLPPSDIWMSSYDHIPFLERMLWMLIAFAFVGAVGFLFGMTFVATARCP